MVEVVRSRRRASVLFAWFLSLLLVVAVTWWAVSATLGRPEIETEGVQPQTVTVQVGSLGRSITVPVNANWTLTPLADAQASGTVTSVDLDASGRLSSGEPLLSVDLRTTVVAQGAIPSFRALSQGDKGSDVTQLQEFLVSQGHLEGEADGVFGSQTLRAVRSWQYEVGLPVDGVVRASDVIYSPIMPARVIVPEEIRVGSRISGGQTFAYLVAETPEFQATLETGQAMYAPVGAGLIVSFEESRWDAVVVDLRTDTETGLAVATLTAPGGGSLCGGDCEQIPVPADGSTTRLLGEIVIAPDTEGSMIPVSSIGTSSSGETFVLMADGEKRSVTVLLASDGQAIVTGVDVGESVMLTSVP